jgi:hypothetical protein
MPARRRRLAALVASLLVAASAVVGAAPAQAVVFDGEPVRVTARFTVAGADYTLTDRSYGDATRTVTVGGVSGTVPVHYRLTFKDERGRVLARVERGLEKASYLLERFTDRSFATKRAFRAAQHRALTVSARTADAHYAKGIRILSLQSDLEATIAATFDHLDGLPAGSKPDFSAVTTVKSPQYPGTATVSGNDATYWTVTIRDTRDGIGMVYDHATGAETSFRF